MDISSYNMQSEQPKVVGKHLTRFAKNGMAVATYIAKLHRGHKKLLVRPAIAAAVAG